jgi:hypothetical protein
MTGLASPGAVMSKEQVGALQDPAALSVPSPPGVGGVLGPTRVRREGKAKGGRGFGRRIDG